MMNQSVVVVSGSLQPFRRGFEDRLVELGYRPSSVLRRLVVVAQFSRWLATEGVEPEELSACGMDAFVAQVANTSRYRRRTARRALRDLLGYLVELGVVRAGEAPVLDDPTISRRDAARMGEAQHRRGGPAGIPAAASEVVR